MWLRYLLYSFSIAMVLFFVENIKVTQYVKENCLQVCFWWSTKTEYNKETNLEHSCTVNNEYKRLPLKDLCNFATIMTSSRSIAISLTIICVHFFFKKKKPTNIVIVFSSKKKTNKKKQLI